MTQGDSEVTKDKKIQRMIMSMSPKTVVLYVKEGIISLEEARNSIVDAYDEIYGKTQENK